MSRLLFCLILCAVAFAGCEQDAYDKGDASYSYMRADFVEAVVGSDKRIAGVVTDDDVQLRLTTPFTASWIQRADTVYRAVMFYNLGVQEFGSSGVQEFGSSGVQEFGSSGVQEAEVVSLQRIATLSVRTSRQVGFGVADDPLKLESVWLSGNKKYLNLRVVVMTGLTDDDGATQSLGMVSDTILVGDDGLRTCHLRLLHSQGDVPQYYSQRVYFSVPVDRLEADSLRLTVNTYDGVVTKGFRL